MTSCPRLSRASLLVAMSLAGSALVVAPAPASAAAPPARSLTRDEGARPSPRTRGRNDKRKKKASRTPSTKGPMKSASGARTLSSRPKRRRTGGQRALAGARAATPPIAQLNPLPPLVPSPGPSSTPEALRAQDRAARGQIERAASAARRPTLTERWQTVSFLLSGVDGTRYPEATFWRALAAYRRGDLAGGDKVRLRSSPLAAADVSVLDAERSAASRAEGSIAAAGDEGTAVAGQPGAPGFRRAAYMEGASDRSSGAADEAPYTGPAPSSSAASVAAN